MDNAFWDSVLTFCQNTTERVGQQLIKDFGKIQAVRKTDGSLVTEADKWSDQEIRTAIGQSFPDHGVLSEETQHIFPDNDWCWVIDPIDGTTNFTRGIPIWGISLGLLYQGMPVFGFVNFPQIRQQFYGYWYGDTGLTGPTGAYLNGQPLHTSPDNPSQNHIFNLCARSTDVMKTPFPCKIRMIGVASYNSVLVASGAALGGVEATPKIWDIAAVWSIVQAAGGVFVTLEPDPVFPLTKGQDYGERPFPSLVASREELLPVFRPLVQFIGDRVLNETLV
ncbi:inositol monophosphatase family protein [Spirulina sp. CS-785/01]|uniref:inositol monophosphatase family protein n=1 Tax=Spirulina sp. CS-785/01 TaxID=3021716 RepID=UPI0023313BCB|nr:inositol monophosphatase family protein [Spirulina sp. CS-785/01]MDB9312864.1 inositol monophosphatase family protein [Spirulina sp. CS-785/01]